MICAWPNYGTTNQRGQCVVGIGLQSNLDGSCQTYCQDWGNRVSGQTFSYHVVTKPSESSNGTTCVCKRISSEKFLEFVTRPQKSCDNVGPTDDEINSWKSASETFKNNIMSNTSNKSDAIWGNTSGIGNNEPSTLRFDYIYGLGTTKQYATAYIDMSNKGFASSGDVSRLASMVAFAPAMIMEHTDSGFINIYNGITKIGDSLATALAYSRNAATGQQLTDAVADLRYSINSRSGVSSTPTDLTPVMNGISQLSADVAAGRAAQIEATNAVAESVSTISGHLGGMGRTIDSGATARWKKDNHYRDSINKELSDHYEAANGTKDGANAAIGEMQGAGTGAGLALSGWRASNCDDAPIIQIPYLEGNSIDVTGIFNGMGGTVMAVVRVIELAGGLAAGAFFGLRVILKES